jgi:ribosome-binding protein aMBF1 (putative translation factor)
MKYICNICSKIIQEHDVTIHYTKSSDGLETLAICQMCLEDYLKKTKVDTDRKDEDTERMKMKRKW